MKVWITKYALTTGVQEVEAKVSDSNEDTIWIMHPHGYRTYYHKSDWRKTLQEANECAERLCARRIASLKKQIARLESLTFTLRSE